MREYRADLHIHTVLSACAEVEMIPPLIVEAALSRGLDIIAITDHNTTGNALAVQEAADGTALTSWSGWSFRRVRKSIFYAFSMHSLPWKRGNGSSTIP